MNDETTAERRGPSDVLIVAVLAVLAAVVTIVVQAAVFPHGSINNDEAIYRLQAQAIQHGHFFVPVVAPMGAFRPWLAAAVHHHWVLKYVPVEGVLLATAGAVTGTQNAALPVVAAAAAFATWLLVREVFEDRSIAIVATARGVASPLVVVQSALLVGYLPTLVLLEVFAWTLIRTVRRPGIVWSLIGGVAIGLAAVARPYDALLFTAPVIVWAVVRQGRRALVPLLWYVLGALPPLVGMLLYDWAATGNPLRLPFNLLEPADKPGFGPRRMFPQEPYHAFGLRTGLSGSANHLLLTIGWVAGGPILVLLAVVGIWRRRRSGRALSLAAVAIAFPVGYVFFWGAWNASNLWHGVRFVGPFYFLPMVVPLAAFGGAELVTIYRRWRPLALGAVVVGLVSSLLVAAPAFAADARWSRQDGAVLAMVNRQAATSSSSLVLIQSDQEYVMHPISGLANRWDGTGPLVYGLWSGTTQDLAALATQPGRQPYVLTLFGPFAPHPRHLAATIRPIRAESGATVTIHVSTSGSAAGPGLTVVVPAESGAAGSGAAGSGAAGSGAAGSGAAGSQLPCPAAPVVPAAAGGWDLSISGTGAITCASSGSSPDQMVVPLAGPSPAAAWDGSLLLRIGTGTGVGASLTLPMRVSGGMVTVLAVGLAVGVVGTPPVGLLTAE